MTYEEKLERYEEINQELRSIMDAAAKEGRRSATPAERAKGQPLIDELEELEQDIRSGKALEQGKENKKFFGGSASITRPNPGGSFYRSAPKLFKSFGEQMQAVRAAGTPGGQIDNRLYELRAASGLNEGTAADGGFLVQTDFGQEILQTMWDASPILSKLTRYTISGNSNGIKIPAVDETSRATGSRTGGVTGYWISEAGEKTKSQPKFRQMELSLKKLVCLIYSTDELLNDSAALGQFIRDAARREIEFQMLNAVINGTGAGQPLGIINSGCLVQVAKESGQLADTVVAENIFKMWARLQESNPASTAWLVNRNVLPQLFQMSMSVGTGGIPVYLPANISGSPFSTLFGRPVIITEQCPTLGDLGDILLCDLSQYIMIEKASGIEEAMSIHVLFTSDQSTFRFVFRTDGQPALASAITPFTGSDTVSPFVALAARA